MRIAPHGDSEPLLKINTTPLIDVMLVLLIVFVVSLPIMTRAVKLDIQFSAAPAIPRETIDIETSAAARCYGTASTTTKRGWKNTSAAKAASSKKPQSDGRAVEFAVQVRHVCARACLDSAQRDEKYRSGRS